MCYWKLNLKKIYIIRLINIIFVMLKILNFFDINGWYVIVYCNIIFFVFMFVFGVVVFVSNLIYIIVKNVD